MQNKLKDAVVLITGSSRGIGRATLEEFLDYGAKVILHSRRPVKELETIAKRYPEGQVYPVSADLSKPEDCSFLLKSVIDKFGKLDILVNNAGIIYREQEILPNSSTWQNTLQVNLLAIVELIRMSVPYLNKSEIASIVNVSSIYGTVGTLETLSYSVSKGGINTLTRTLAKEYAPKIRVNAVAPGNVDTELTKSGGEKVSTYFNEVTPLKRSATPQEIASGIVFLASPAASFITGQILTIDGGYSIR